MDIACGDDDEHGMSQTAWNRDIKHNKELEKYFKCLIKKFKFNSIKESVEFLNIIIKEFDIDIKWYVNAVNRKDRNDPKRIRIMKEIAKRCNIQKKNRKKKRNKGMNE